MKNLLKKIILLIPSFLMLFFVAHTVLGQTGGGTPPPSNTQITFPNPLAAGTNTLQAFISLIIQNVIIPVGAVISVFFIILAGFSFVTARGNVAKIATAKQSLLYAAIGSGVLLGAWAIANVINGTISQIVPGS